MSEWTSATLIRLAAQAEPMTPALWGRLKREYALGAAQGAQKPGMGHRRSTDGARWDSVMGS